MRLEEWQKWLDLQFLDTQESVKTQEPPSPANQAPVEVAAVVTEPAATAPERSAPPPVMPAPPPITSGEDLEVPSLERYLPFLRDRQAVVESPTPESEAAAPTPSDTEPFSIPSPPTVHEAEAKPEQPPIIEPPAAPKAALSPITAEAAAPLTARETDASEPAEEAEGDVLLDRDEPPRPAARRYGISHRRAKHARNVRPADVVENMSAEVLWSLVPKHIQTLIALGSDETAQNSYKRSFKETRLELIHRLLDPTLSLEDAARLLNVCPTTVRRYTNRGLLTHQRTPGDQRRFRLSDVLAFLEAQSRTQKQ